MTGSFLSDTAPAADQCNPARSRVSTWEPETAQQPERWIQEYQKWWEEFQEYQKNFKIAARPPKRRRELEEQEEEIEEEIQEEESQESFFDSYGK